MTASDHFFWNCVLWLSENLCSTDITGHFDIQLDQYAPETVYLSGSAGVFTSLLQASGPTAGFGKWAPKRCGGRGGRGKGRTAGKKRKWKDKSAVYASPIGNLGSAFRPLLVTVFELKNLPRLVTRSACEHSTGMSPTDMSGRHSLPSVADGTYVTVPWPRTAKGVALRQLIDTKDVPRTNSTMFLHSWLI